jgi:hypothetical protein
LTATTFSVTQPSLPLRHRIMVKLSVLEYDQQTSCWHHFVPVLKTYTG